MYDVQVRAQRGLTTELKVITIGPTSCQKHRVFTKFKVNVGAVGLEVYNTFGVPSELWEIERGQPLRSAGRTFTMMLVVVEGGGVTAADHP